MELNFIYRMSFRLAESAHLSLQSRTFHREIFSRTLQSLDSSSMTRLLWCLNPHPFVKRTQCHFFHWNSVCAFCHGSHCWAETIAVKSESREKRHVIDVGKLVRHLEASEFFVSLAKLTSGKPASATDTYHLDGVSSPIINASLLVVTPGFTQIKPRYELGLVREGPNFA